MTLRAGPVAWQRVVLASTLRPSTSTSQRLGPFPPSVSPFRDRGTPSSPQPIGAHSRMGCREEPVPDHRRPGHLRRLVWLRRLAAHAALAARGPRDGAGALSGARAGRSGLRDRASASPPGSACSWLRRGGAEAHGHASLTVVWSVTYSGWRSWWERSALPEATGIDRHADSIP